MAPLLDIKKATKIYGGGMLSAGPVTVALQDYDLTIESPHHHTIARIRSRSRPARTVLASRNLIRPIIYPPDWLK